MDSTVINKRRPPQSTTHMGLQCDLLMREEWMAKTAWHSLAMTRNCFANGLKALIAHCATCMHLVHAFLLVTPLSCAALTEQRIIEIIWFAVLFREIEWSPLTFFIQFNGFSQKVWQRPQIQIKYNTVDIIGNPIFHKVSSSI